MDLVCLIDNKEAALHASDLVAMIGDLLERGAFGDCFRPLSRPDAPPAHRDQL